MSQSRGIGAFFRILGPGMLVAATGVGAGDLATAAFAGHRLGLAVLWAVVLGAAVKYVLNEGLARWQLATGETLLEGCVRLLGWPFVVLFGLYFLCWSFFTGAAMMSACGATVHAILPVFDSADAGKFAFGILCSATGVALVFLGGYRLFQRMMAVCIGIMFFTVIATAVRLAPDLLEFLLGMTIPRIPEGADGLAWTVAVMGGIGGTLTVLCYGYWIREEGREGPEQVRLCRLDLAAGYVMTALFGLAMVVVGGAIELPEGGKPGAGLIVAIASRLEGPMGPVGKWLFLLGAFGAVFSSLLGVWQAVPYIFADFVAMARRGGGRAAHVDLERTTAYRVYLILIATVPILNLRLSFASIQQAYAVLGAYFMPFLALTLLLLNNRRKEMGDLRNRRPVNAVLIAILALFTYTAWRGLGE